MRHRLIPLVLACALPWGAQAKVRLIEAGIVCPEVREAAETRPAPNTEMGHIDIIEDEIVFDLPDRQVPLIPHLSFGLRVALKDGVPATDITVVVEHPAFGSRKVSRESWSQSVDPGATTVNLFSFDFPYEMVAGTWTFAVEIDGTRHVEVPFEVGAPGAMEKVDAVCLSTLSV